MGVSFLSPKARPTGDGNVTAVSPIAAGEVVAAFGGRCVPGAGLDRSERQAALQIEDDLYLVGGEVAATVPHSCEPTCELSGSVVLVARRAVAPGEALTFDHATALGDDAAEFECSCGAPSCRGTVTGRDWMLPELQLRYRGHFSPFLTRRISALVGTGAERRAFAL